MTDNDHNPAPINRPLTDEERSLMNMLAIEIVAQQTGCDADTAAATLDQLASESEITLRHVYLEACGKVLVHATREGLAFHAEHPEAIDPARHAHPISDDDTDEEAGQ